MNRNEISESEARGEAENPYHHFGIVEPGGSLTPDPGCAVHFPKETNA